MATETKTSHLTGQDYAASLRDGRIVVLDGKSVADVTATPLLAVSVKHVATSYDAIRRGERPALTAMARTQSELQEQMDAFHAIDSLSVTTAGVLRAGRLAAAKGDAASAGEQRLAAFTGLLSQNDARVAVGRADAGASKLRVVSRTEDGVIVRGAKAHVVGAPVAHEILCIPDRPTAKSDPATVIAFAVPVSAPGVKLVSLTAAPRSEDTRHYPISRERSMADAVVLFDDVFVPNDRIFVDGAVKEAEELASVLGVWERATAVYRRAREAELVLGLAQTIAEMNGVPDVSHIRHKLSDLAVYAAISRATWEAALAHAKTGIDGSLVPDDVYIYSSKVYTDDLHSEMLSYLHDVSGALLLTCPTVADYENEATHVYIEKYLRTMVGVTGEDRMKVFHLIRDLSADTYWGWSKIDHQSIAGGVDAQREAVLNNFDLSRARKEVIIAAGLRGS
ncbi:hypothetical protein AYO38_11495 [bacterium SCGC AG-212-C10]|nr:hypothetical protein AYO38_11495 [bacterium SCGC AG-212-C10]